jgi:hypothetical protein
VGALRQLWLSLALLCAATPAFADEEEKPKEPPPGDPVALSAEAEAARAAGLFEKCIEKDQAAIEIAPSTERRVHLAGCADKANKVLLALAQLRPVLDDALEKKNAEVAELVSKRVEQLLKRLGSITIDPPPGAEDLWVEVDGVAVTETQLNKPLAIDPGTHRIHAKGNLNGRAAEFDEVKDVPAGERVTVGIVLVPKDAAHLTIGQLECMHDAKTDEEAFRCLPAKSKPLVVRAAAEMSAFADSLDVLILNPEIRFNVASPTKGWSFGGSYLIDVISAASPDFVSTASPTGHDLRHAFGVNGAYKPGKVGADVNGGISTEHDYDSRFVGVGVLGDFFEKRFTPRLGWTYSNDTISRGGTPNEFFHHTLITNEGVLSLSMVLSPKMVLVLGGTAGFERGDQSKPYRLIPMFADGVTDKQIPAGASPNLVNANRLPVRPYEQLPKERNRVAAGIRLIRRFGPSTLRFEERLYVDTWQNKSTTTDVRWLIDLTSRFTLGPHFRYHLQSGANFFHRVYHAELAPQIVVPQYRTTDRELGPFYGFTGGASMSWRLSAEDANLGWMLYASGDGLFDFYTDSLYITSRQAVYGTVGIEATFE